MAKSYQIIKEEELRVKDTVKLFKENTEYFWDVFIRVYKEKFTPYEAAEDESIEIILDGGSAVYSDNKLLDLNEQYIGD